MARRSRKNESDGGSDGSASAAANATTDKKRYVTWDDHAAEVLLRLRFDTMQRAFASRTNPLEVAALWTTLAAHLQRLTGRAFTTTQCQGKVCLRYVVTVFQVVVVCPTWMCHLRSVYFVCMILQLKALRAKWRVDLGRKGQQNINTEDFETHALRWIASVNAQKRAKGKAKKSKNKQPSQPLEAPSESFAELLASFEAPTATVDLEQTGYADENDCDYGFANDNYEEAGHNEDVEQQAAQAYKDESSLLALLRRQTTAVEAISSPSDSAHEEWLELSREQVRLAREQVELNLFLVRANPEDTVAQEYLTLKRSQARDRLKNEIAAQNQQREAQAQLYTSRVAIPRLSHAI